MSFLTIIDGMCIKNLFILIIFYFTVSPIFGQVLTKDYFDKNVEIYLKLSDKNKSQLEWINNHISLDHPKADGIYAYANYDGYKFLIENEIKFEILKRPSMLKPIRVSDNIDSVMNWNVYPRYQTYLELMYKFASDYPNLCKVIDAGETIEGRKIIFAIISDSVNSKENEPQVMYSSTMHGDETTGYVLMLRLIDYLLKNYNSDSLSTKLVKNLEIWINPLANPDGTYFVSDTTINGARRYNYFGYDLNRNFPDPVFGVNQNEQLETKIMRGILEENNFVLSANFHGGVEVINYPWDRWEEGHPDSLWFALISRKYADTAQTYSTKNYLVDYDNGITNGFKWTQIIGGRQDYQDYFNDGRETTIELDATKTTPENELNDLWNFNYRSLLQYLEQSLFGLSGTVKDKNGLPLSAEIQISGDQNYSTSVNADSNSGLFRKMLFPGEYKVIIVSDGFDSLEIENVNISADSLTKLSIELDREGTTFVSDNGINSNRINLYQNYPNPFNPKTQIEFDLNTAQFISIKIYDSIGNELDTILDDFKAAGTHRIIFDASDYPSGVYFYKLGYGKYSQVRKMILIK